MTGVTEKMFMCQKFMCLFWPLKILRKLQKQFSGSCIRTNFVSKGTEKNAYHYTQKRLPNRTLLFFELFFANSCSVITEPTCLFLELHGLDKKCEQRITESLTELFLGNKFGNLGGGITKPKLFWN